MYVILYIEHNRSTANNASHLSLILFTVWSLGMVELMEIFWYFICLNMYVILYIEHNGSTANNASQLSLDPVYSVNHSHGGDESQAKLYLSQME